MSQSIAADERVSKVKQPLEEAKAFATNAGTVAGVGADQPLNAAADVAPIANAEEFREQYVAKKTATVIEEEATPVAFSSERALRNAELKSMSYALEMELLKMVQGHVGDALRLRAEEDKARAASHVAVQKLHREIIDPPLAGMPFADLVERFQLKMPADRVVKMKETAFGVAEMLTKAPSVLEDKTCEESKGRGRGISLDGVIPLAKATLDDGPLILDVMQPLKVLAWTDPFYHLVNELLASDKEIVKLTEALTALRETKETALACDDIEKVEQLSWEEIDLLRAWITKVHERLEDVYASNSELSDYLKEYEGLRTEANSRLQVHKKNTEQHFNFLVADAEVTGNALLQATQDSFDNEEKFTKVLQGSDAKLKGLVERQHSNWAKIMELLEENARLGKEHEEEVIHHISIVTDRAQAKAEEDQLQTALERYRDALAEAKSFAVTAKTWVKGLDEFVEHQCARVEAKNLEERALEIRIQEQLGYLDVYGTFKKATAELGHKKETRLAALQRLQRSLELQISEAAVVLDPYKRRYQEELEVVRRDADATQKLLALLLEHSEQQTALWKPVEAQLEDARVDFTPPDLEVEKLRCQRKAEAIDGARKFLGKEIETVDKDQIKLRKLKSSTTVAIEEAEKRKERVKALDAPPSTAALADAAKAGAPPAAGGPTLQ